MTPSSWGWFSGAYPSFEVHSARFADRVGPDGQLVPQCMIELLQHADEVESSTRDRPARGFEGGSTIVVDLRDPDTDQAVVRYIIRKSMNSKARVDRQVAFQESRATATPWNTYFGERALNTGAEPFARHPPELRETSMPSTKSRGRSPALEVRLATSCGWCDPRPRSGQCRREGRGPRPNAFARRADPDVPTGPRGLLPPHLPAR